MVDMPEVDAIKSVIERPLCRNNVYSCKRWWLRMSTPARYCWGNFGDAAGVAIVARVTHH